MRRSPTRPATLRRATPRAPCGSARPCRVHRCQRRRHRRRVGSELRHRRGVGLEVRHPRPGGRSRQRRPHQPHRVSERDPPADPADLESLGGRHRVLQRADCGREPRHGHGRGHCDVSARIGQPDRPRLHGRPQSRLTIPVNDVAGLSSTAVSAVVTATTRWRGRGTDDALGRPDGGTSTAATRAKAFPRRARHGSWPKAKQLLRDLHLFANAGGTAATVTATISSRAAPRWSAPISSAPTRP